MAHRIRKNHERKRNSFSRIFHVSLFSSSGYFLWEKEPEQNWRHGNLWSRGPPCTQESTSNQAWWGHCIPSPISLWPVLSGNSQHRATSISKTGVPKHYRGSALQNLHPQRIQTKGKIGSGTFGRWEHIVVAQSLSHVPLFATPWTVADKASLSFTISQNLLKLICTESMMSSNHLILCCPLLLLPSVFPSIRVFSNESGFLSRWPNYWAFSFSTSPSNEHSGLISFMIDWCDILQSKGLSRVFSSTTVTKQQFFSSQLSLWSNSHIYTWLLEKP